MSRSHTHGRPTVGGQAGTGSLATRPSNHRKASMHQLCPQTEQRSGPTLLQLSSALSPLWRLCVLHSDNCQHTVPTHSVQLARRHTWHGPVHSVHKERVCDVKLPQWPLPVVLPLKSCSRISAATQELSPDGCYHESPAGTGSACVPIVQ